MPFGLLFVVVFLCMLWRELPIAGKTFGEVVTAAMQLPADRVADTFLAAAVAVGIVFKAIDLTIGLRVSQEEEMRGLDIGEHGMEAYGGFQVFSTM